MLKPLPSNKKTIRRPTLVESRIVLNYYKGLKSLPDDLNSAGNHVFLLMGKCFQIANDVREAPIAEVIWGLSKGGYPPALLIGGLRDLQEKGYIVLTDAHCNVLDLNTVGDTTKVWYMLTDKWLKLLVPQDSTECGLCPDVYFEKSRIVDGEFV